MAGSFDEDNNFISSGFLSLKETDGMGKKERKGKGRRTNIEKCKTGIAYQNKDIVSKIFAESLKEKSLNVYGLNVPKVVGVLPTNLRQWRPMSSGLIISFCWKMAAMQLLIMKAHIHL